MVKLITQLRLPGLAVIFEVRVQRGSKVSAMILGQILGQLLIELPSKHLFRLASSQILNFPLATP